MFFSFSDTSPEYPESDSPAAEQPSLAHQRDVALGGFHVTAVVRMLSVPAVQVAAAGPWQTCCGLRRSDEKDGRADAGLRKQVAVLHIPT